jgi:lysozyme
VDLNRQLRRDEGERLRAYKDSLGYWTIGVGILIDPVKGAKPPAEMTWPDGPGKITTNCTISQAVSDRLLEEHIKSVRSRLAASLPWYTGLDDARRGVLENMAFNLGVPGLLKFKNTLALIEGHKWDDAAVAMLQSKWATQVGKRARRLSDQMRTGVWQ